MNGTETVHQKAAQRAQRGAAASATPAAEVNEDFMLGFWWIFQVISIIYRKISVVYRKISVIYRKILQENQIYN